MCYLEDGKQIDYILLTIYLLVSSADNLWKQFGHRLGPKKMSGLNWIQTV